MLENKFFLLFINFLWMAGLFGALFTLIYMVQYRRKHWWNIGYTYNVPRLLAPLYGSLLIFVSGLALHAYTAQRSISLWVALVWGVLALFFLFRTLDVIFAALQSGWDSVLAPPQAEEGGRPGLPIWSSSVIVLLLANLLLLGWWGTVQLNAGALDLSWLERGRATGKSTPKITPPALAQSALPAPVKNDPLAVQANAVTPTVGVTRLITHSLAPVSNTLLFTGTVIPVISTLDASDLQVTPTPEGALSGPTTVPAVAIAPIVTTTGSSPQAAMAILTPTASRLLTITSLLTVTPLSTIAAPVSPTLTPVSTPTASSISAPTVMPTVLSTASAGPLITVQSATGANVHAAPDASANIVWLLANATAAPVLGRTADNQWFLIRLSNGSQGWVDSNDLVFQGTIDLVLVVASR